MDLTVNQWLGEFDPHTRSQFFSHSVSGYTTPFGAETSKVRVLHARPSFVKVSARECHAGQHSSKVLVSRRGRVQLPADRKISADWLLTGLVSQVTYRVLPGLVNPGEWCI